MSTNIEEEVVRIDASATLQDDKTVLQLLSRSIEHTESGVVDLFRVVVREDLSTISTHAPLYERLLHSALSLRVLILCTTGGRPATQAVDGGAIPDAILNAGDSSKATTFRVKSLVLAAPLADTTLADGEVVSMVRGTITIVRV